MPSPRGRLRPSRGGRGWPYCTPITPIRTARGQGWGANGRPSDASRLYVALVCGLTRESGLNEWSELIMSHLVWDEIPRAFKEMNTELADQNIDPKRIQSPLARTQIEEFRKRAR